MPIRYRQSKQAITHGLDQHSPSPKEHLRTYIVVVLAVVCARRRRGGYFRLSDGSGGGPRRRRGSCRGGQRLIWCNISAVAA